MIIYLTKLSKNNKIEIGISKITLIKKSNPEILSRCKMYIYKAFK